MSDRTRLVLLGSLGVAADCLEWLIEQPRFELLGVVCATGPISKWRQLTGDRDARAVAGELGVELLELDDLVQLKPDLALSVRFHAILRRRHIQSARLGVVNLHGAPLPEMRGSMCDAMAIIEGRPRFGASLHWMDEGIDTGELLAVERFPVKQSDTVYDLFQRSNAAGLELIKTHLADIAAGKTRAQPQDIVCERQGITPKAYRTSDVLALKSMSPPLDPMEIWNRARAFQFPGHEPAFINTPVGPVYLTATELQGTFFGNGARVSVVP
jgi:methionyl-tRNA formyltransferase